MNTKVTDKERKYEPPGITLKSTLYFLLITGALDLVYYYFFK
jgi:hypothetical protein